MRRSRVAAATTLIALAVPACSSDGGVTRTTAETANSACLSSLTWPAVETYVGFVDYDAARALGVLTAAIDVGPYDDGTRQAYADIRDSGLHLPDVVELSIVRALPSVVGTKDVRCSVNVRSAESVRLTADATVNEDAWRSTRALVHIDDRLAIAEREEDATLLTESSSGDDNDIRRSIVERLSAAGAYQGVALDLPGTIDWSGVGLASGRDGTDLLAVVWYAPDLDDDELMAAFDAALATSAIDGSTDVAAIEPEIADGWLTMTAPIDNPQIPDILRQRSDRLVVPID